MNLEEIKQLSLEGEGIDPELEEDTLEKTKTHFNLRGNLEVINKSKKNPWIIAGYANIAVVDSDDQFIPIETLKKGIESLLKDPHYSNLMLVHQNIQIGKIVEKYKKLKTHVDDKGLFIVAEIRKDIQTAREIWESILKNEINGFSIGCEVIQSHKKCDEDKCILILDEINIFEVSVCTKPVNEESGFIVVSKSQRDYVCDECKIEMSKMTKDEESIEEIVEESEETEIIEESVETEEKIGTLKIDEPEVETLSVDERISNIEREIAAMSEIIQSLANKPEEDEEKSAEDTEEKQDPEEDEPEEDTPEGTEEEPEEDKPLPFQKSFDDIIEKLSTIADKLSKNIEGEDLKLSIKARDDQIKALEKQVEVLVKSSDDDETKPQTIQDESDNVPLEKENPIKVHRGTVYYKE